MDIKDGYTLWTSKGTFNLASARVLQELLRQRYSETDVNLGRRCLISDARDWRFQTPECSDLIGQLFIEIASHHSEFYLANILDNRVSNFSKFLVDKISKNAPENFISQTFTELHPALSWLRSNGFEIPELTMDDFPTAIYAEEYLKTL